MIDFKKYKNQGYSEWQLEELKLATKSRVRDELIGLYLANVNYNAQQMEQVRIGLIQGVDVSLFADENILSDTMKTIREKLLEQKENKNIALEQMEQVNAEQQKLDNKDHIKLHKTLTAMKLGIKLLLIIVLLLFILIAVIYIKKEILNL